MWEIVAVVIGVCIGKSMNSTSVGTANVSSGGIPISEDPITPYFISFLIFMFIILPAMQIIPELIAEHRAEKLRKAKTLIQK